ncbi:MAG: hypothetical protein M3N98_12740 [Actinomycetota bacterium]|nr:hypothetical protein [Actinomycetota bacterium]
MIEPGINGGPQDQDCPYRCPGQVPFEVCCDVTAVTPRLIDGVSERMIHEAVTYRQRARPFVRGPLRVNHQRPGRADHDAIDVGQRS